MNLFFLDREINRCAEAHNNRHAVKMLLEYCQILSTAHRVLDGESRVVLSTSGRKATVWQLDDDRDTSLYKATHINHPTTQWARKSRQHYSYLQKLVTALSKEYTYRYGRVHKVEDSGLIRVLEQLPKNLGDDGWVDPPPAMPDEFKSSDVVTSYRNYYMGPKKHIAQWKNRDVPEWFRFE
jgi:hypothetical protein